MTELADNVFVVLFAYIAAFLPWTAFAATDFINPIWQSIRDTRRGGRYNLFFSLGPASYIVFYVVLQARSGDYKETFAAIVALLFALQHTARTVWGLWQLSYFREWAATSIVALRAVGIQFGEKEQPLDKMVDDLLVNENVIDNQLLHGESRCYLQYGKRILKLEHSEEKSEFMRARLRFLAVLLLFILEWVKDFAVYILFGKQMPKLRQVPFEPVGVWLNWSAAFVAQGLKQWVHQFQVLEEPDESSELSNAELYKKRRAHFAGEVLASAAMHLWPESIGVAIESPLLWAGWEESTGIKGGKICKIELLIQAMFCGAILPFGCPHLERNEDGKCEYKLAKKGYKTYARKLERIVEAFPADFGEEVEMFDHNMLEWFTIMLYLGAESMQLGQKRRRVVKSNAMHEIEKAEVSWTCIDETVHRDIAVINLRDQLGIDDINEWNVSKWVAFPFLGLGLHQIADDHPLVLKVGELIDVWLALLSGDQMSWGETLYSKPDESSLGDMKMQEYIEFSRLKRQFANPGHRFWHLEQSLSFMGHSMEVLRSRLATWEYCRLVDRNSESAETWKPRIDFEQVGEMMLTEWLQLGKITSAIGDKLRAPGAVRFLQRRVVQVRLVWEAQCLLKKLCCVDEFGTPPSSLRAMLLFMLSFPTLTTEVHPSDANDGADSEHNYSRLTICPHSGPQPYAVVLEIFNDEDDVWRIRACLRKKGECEGGVFDWQTWRDSFMTRLETNSKWQSAMHFMVSKALPILPANNPISSGCSHVNIYYKGQYEDFRMWKGWGPFRISDCMFELGSSAFAKQKPVPEKLTSIMRNEIRHGLAADNELEAVGMPRTEVWQACMLISEIARQDGIAGLKTQDVASKDVAERVVRHASLLLSRSHKNTERALLLLETAAGGLGSSEAVVTSVQILTSGRFCQKDVYRAAKLIGNNLSLFNLDPSESKSKRLEQVMASFVPVFVELLEETEYSDEAIVMFADALGWLVWAGSESSFDHASMWLKKLFIRSKNFHAIFMLAVLKEIEAMRSTTSRRDVDYCRKSLLERAVRANNPDAMTSLAFLLRNGTAHIPRDLPRAVDLYQRAVEMKTDHGNARSNLIEILEEGGPGVARDLGRATSLALERDRDDFRDPLTPVLISL